MEEREIPLSPWHFIGSKLGFQEGGVVPGPIGAPTPAIVHGGETIIPAEGKSNGNTYNFNFEGAVIGNVEEFKRQIVDLINRDSELNALAGV